MKRVKKKAKNGGGSGRLGPGAWRPEALWEAGVSLFGVDASGE
jgi:hypothetical protein